MARAFDYGAIAPEYANGRTNTPFAPATPGTSTPSMADLAGGPTAPTTAAPTTPGTDPTPTTPYTNSLISPSARARIIAAYKRLTGRTPNEAEINSQLGYGRAQSEQNIAWAEAQIANSPEAKAWAKQQSTAANTTPGTTTPGTTTPGATGPAASTTAAAPASYRFTGFDFARTQDPTKSAKDAFAEASRAAATSGVAASTWATKAGAQAFAEQYIKPVLEKYGFTVLEIRGDKMRVITAEDKAAGRTQGTWVDFVKNAGGTNPDEIELQWGAETAPDATDPATGWTPSATTTPPTTTAPTSGTNPPPGGRTELTDERRRARRYATTAPTVDSSVPYDTLAPSMADLPYYTPYYR